MHSRNPFTGVRRVYASIWGPPLGPVLKSPPPNGVALGDIPSSALAPLQPSDPLVFGFWKVSKENCADVCYNAIDRHVSGGKADDIALIWEGDEPNDIRKVTYSELLYMHDVTNCPCRGLGRSLGRRCSHHLHSHDPRASHDHDRLRSYWHHSFRCLCWILKGGVTYLGGRLQIFVTADVGRRAGKTI